MHKQHEYNFNRSETSYRLFEKRLDGTWVLVKEVPFHVDVCEVLAALLRDAVSVDITVWEEQHGNVADS